ncbi:anti-sigma factor family protein [Paenibacillus ferrarius]|uniref:anti-sigma factor family protein n=1 Tax=Paenibacillus ferrarius TaxID=1469647 RepID=UPI003D2A8D78
MNHHHPEDQLSAYVDDELSIEEKQAVEAHLKHCESCQALLTEWLAMQAEMKGAFQSIQAPMAFEDRVMQTLEQRQQFTMAQRWLTLPLIAVLLLGVLGMTTGSVLLKLFHSFARLFVVVLYMMMQAISTIPLASVAVGVVSICVLGASIYLLRRALQSASMERG